MIQQLEISNYKSIKHLEMDCRRINVLVGEPNVGKSNILEALDLSYLSWMLLTNESNKKANKELIDVKKYFRVDKASDLFYLGDISRTIKISHPSFSYETGLQYRREDNQNDLDKLKGFFQLMGGSSYTLFNNDFEPLKHVNYFGSPIKPYRFKPNIDYHDTGNYLNTLMPPFGNNLIEVIKHQPDLRVLIGEMMQEVDLELNVDSANNKLFIQKKISQGLIYSLKYEALADTLRRVIFYVAAIRYNNGSIITLEEPDTHSFPKFVSFLADEIIKQTEKQFFIATHNPYLLNRLIEGTPVEDLSVFVCGHNKEKGTYTRKLTGEELSELLDYGVDIFFNINHYLNDKEYSS